MIYVGQSRDYSLLYKNELLTRFYVLLFFKDFKKAIAKSCVNMENVKIRGENHQLLLNYKIND